MGRRTPERHAPTNALKHDVSPSDDLLPCFHPLIFFYLFVPNFRDTPDFHPTLPTLWFRYLAGELEGLVFVPFVVLVAIFWVFLFFKMPETKNKSFEEINAIFARRALNPSTGADGYQEVE